MVGTRFGYFSHSGFFTDWYTHPDLPGEDPGSRYYYWTNHWVESHEDRYGPCAGGDFVCSRDLDGVPPYVGDNGSGGFCSHDPDGSASANQGLGSLHRNLYDHDIFNPFFLFI